MRTAVSSTAYISPYLPISPYISLDLAAVSSTAAKLSSAESSAMMTQ